MSQNKNKFKKRQNTQRGIITNGAKNKNKNKKEGEQAAEKLRRRMKRGRGLDQSLNKKAI